MSELSELLAQVVQAYPRAKITIVTIEPTEPAQPVAGTPCEEDILQTLHEVGHRMLVEQLLVEMEHRGRIHGESTIRHALARMRREKRLSHDDETNPKGFGLPGWTNGKAPVLNGKH